MIRPSRTTLHLSLACLCCGLLYSRFLALRTSRVTSHFFGGGMTLTNRRHCLYAPQDSRAGAEFPLRVGLLLRSCSLTYLNQTWLEAFDYLVNGVVGDGPWCPWLLDPAANPEVMVTTFTLSLTLSLTMLVWCSHGRTAMSRVCLCVIDLTAPGRCCAGWPSVKIVDINNIVYCNWLTPVLALTYI